MEAGIKIEYRFRKAVPSGLGASGGGLVVNLARQCRNRVLSLTTPQRRSLREVLFPLWNTARQRNPYERADITSNTYYDWVLDHVFLLVPAQDYVSQFLATFRDYPQRQKAASFNLDDVLAKLKEAK
jgi:hypothetical protein